MADEWLDKQEKLDPIRARDAMSELRKRSAPVELGVLSGPADVRWLKSQVVRAPAVGSGDLTIETPALCVSDFPVAEGDDIYIYYCADGPGYGFPARVEELGESLAPSGSSVSVIHVAWPTSIYRFQRRRHRRVRPSQEILVTLHVPAGQDDAELHIQGVLEDVSNGGARLRLDGAGDPERDRLYDRVRVHVEFRFGTAQRTECDLPGEAVRCAPVSGLRRGLVLALRWHGDCTVDELRDVAELISRERRTSLRDRLRSSETLKGRRRI